MTPDLDTPLWLLLLIAALSWTSLAIQQQRRRVRHRRAARAGLARVLAQSRQNTGADDGELEQQPQGDQHHRDGHREDERKLKVFDNRHAPSVSTHRARRDAPELVTGVRSA